jgi:Flp pilus assembly pilin Flp
MFFNSFLMDGALTVPGVAVTLRETTLRAFSRRGERGQTAVEYLLTTVVLVMVFASLYGFMQGQLKNLFRAAAVKILRSYY